MPGMSIPFFMSTSCHLPQTLPTPMPLPSNLSYCPVLRYFSGKHVGHNKWFIGYHP